MILKMSTAMQADKMTTPMTSRSEKVQDMASTVDNDW